MYSDDHNHLPAGPDRVVGMNLFKLDDKTRIKALKLCLLGTSAALAGSSFMCYQFGKQYEQDKQKKEVAAKVINEFVKLSPDRVIQQVWEHVAWELVIQGMEFEDGELKETRK
jgi:hypothetical protein